jgi:hypothetical protein
LKRKGVSLKQFLLLKEEVLIYGMQIQIFLKMTLNYFIKFYFELLNFVSKLIIGGEKSFCQQSNIFYSADA